MTPVETPINEKKWPSAFANNTMAYQQYPPNNPQYQPQGGNPYGSVPSYNADPHTAEAGMPKSDVNFTNASIRAGFIRKVFILVTIMLGVVAVMSAVPFFHNDTMRFVRTTPSVYWISYVTFLVVYIALVCCEGVRRSFPANLICTAILTLSIGYMTMMICAFHNLQAVLLTLVITTLACGSIILFAMQTKYDLTSMMGFMFIASMVLMLFGLVAVVSVVAFHVKILYTIYAGLAALLFMVYLAIDIQMIMGGRKYEISPEDHVFAAIQIFLDIIYIFWMLLQLFGSSNN
jgi:FtsH-binding integral membrane protein